MPRKDSKLVQVWLSQSGVDRLDGLADDYQLDRSRVIRAALAVALNSPKLHESLMALSEADL